MNMFPVIVGLDVSCVYSHVQWTVLSQKKLNQRTPGTLYTYQINVEPELYNY